MPFIDWNILKILSFEKLPAAFKINMHACETTLSSTISIEGCIHLHLFLPSNRSSCVLVCNNATAALLWKPSFRFTYALILDWKCVGDALSTLAEECENLKPDAELFNGQIWALKAYQMVVASSLQSEWKPFKPQLSRTEITQPALQPCKR